MNITFTKEQKRWIQDKVKSGRYHSASEVVREAVRYIEQLEYDRDWLEQQIEEGIESGPGIPVDAEYWKRLKADLRRERDPRASRRAATA